MDKSKSTADRVRPILQAMERSIDSARRRRVQGTTPPSNPISHGTSRPTPMTTSTAPQEQATGPVNGSSDGPRLKARPKRATPMTNMPNRPTFQP